METGVGKGICLVFSIKYQNWKRKGRTWMIGFHIKTTLPKCNILSGFAYGEINRQNFAGREEFSGSRTHLSSRNVSRIFLVFVALRSQTLGRC